MVGVSVIVPVYNVEDYLEEFLDSVVNQSFEDIEIICVDDGSTDSSLDILKEYEKQDKRVKVITQENNGQGSARNTGLEYVNGKYIYFCDPDDYLELTALEELFSIAEDKDLDVVLFKLRNFEDGTDVFSCHDYHEMHYLDRLGDKVFGCHDIIDVVLDMDVSVCTKFFKRDLIDDIRFNEDLIFEDNLFFIEYVFKADKMYFYRKHLYNRRIRSNSTMTSNSKRHVDVIEIYNLIASKIKEYGAYDILKERLFKRKLETTVYRYGSVVDEYKEYFFNSIKKDLTEKQDEYERELDFSIIEERIKCYFYDALNSRTHREYSLKINALHYNKEMHTLISNFKRLKKYQTARIDMKSYGSEKNRINILSNSDDYSKVSYPKWLKNQDGEGLIIESFNDYLDLEIQTVGDGELKISLRARDVRDRNSERFPIFIDYTSFSVNDDEYLEDNALVSHDHPFIIKRKVNDSEILKIHFEWSVFTFHSVYDEKLRSDYKLKSENEELKQNVKDLKNENNLLKEQLDEMRSSKLGKILKFKK